MGKVYYPEKVGWLVLISLRQAGLLWGYMRMTRCQESSSQLTNGFNPHLGLVNCSMLSAINFRGLGVVRNDGIQSAVLFVCVFLFFVLALGSDS